VLKKAQPRYAGKVDFCRWNVNDKENTVEIKSHFIEKGYTLNKLPSLIIYRDGIPIAVRPGFANEFQLDDWLEKTLPDVLERTFDENGIKMEPSQVMQAQWVNENNLGERSTQVVIAKESKVERRLFSPIDFKSTLMTERLRIIRDSNVRTTSGDLPSGEDESDVDEDGVDTICMDETKCWELVAETFLWENRTVTPATFGLPKRVLLA
jgi:thioredoxin 1